MRVPWIARKSNQSILREINPEYSLEGLVLKLKLQYFGRMIQRANSLEKIEGKRRRWVTEDEMAGRQLTRKLGIDSLVMILSHQ